MDYIEKILRRANAHQIAGYLRYFMEQEKRQGRSVNYDNRNGKVDF